MSNFSDTFSDAPSDAVRSTGVHRATWGIFNIAYEPPSWKTKISEFSLTEHLAALDSAQFAWRFICEVCCIAPRCFISYVLASWWISITPALSLYFSHLVIDTIHECVSNSVINDHSRSHLQHLVLLWSLLSASSAIVERLRDEIVLILGAHLKAHFMPELARACLQLDVDFCPEANSLHAALPNSQQFGNYTPGLKLLEDLFKSVHNILALSLEILVLIYVIYLKGNPDAVILTYLVVFFFVVLFLMPTNAFGGAGFTFWTGNEDYLRLNGLYSIIFDKKYRATLAKDALSQYLYEEYKRTSDALGVVKSDTLALAFRQSPPWYWMVARAMIVEYPLVLYTLALPWTLSSSTLPTTAFFQYAIYTLCRSIEIMRRGTGPTTLAEIFHEARQFYERLSLNASHTQGIVEYPSFMSSPKGMKISFRDVLLHYPEENPSLSKAHTRESISLDIQPGQLVVIVGVNGSGKTSLLKLLPRLAEPKSGSIFIDDQPLHAYDMHQLRHSMAYLTQSEEIYPISLRENLLMGLKDLTQHDLGNTGMVDEASRLGNSYDIIQRLGYDAVLNPPPLVSQSFYGCSSGLIGKAAMEEYQCHSGNRKGITVSEGEKQRLVASRTFMRVKNSDIRLLVVDEPTSAFDAIAERDLFNRFLEMRKGKTMIFVTHRFGYLVKNADLILCMDGGHVVQRGTHAELMCSQTGIYAKLYQAQAEGFH